MIRTKPSIAEIPSEGNYRVANPPRLAKMVRNSKSFIGRFVIFAHGFTVDAISRKMIVCKKRESETKDSGNNGGFLI
ncbi:hypothetical protein ECG_06514 [Echinococcus granulosus]|uniref:Expressed protein n=1 Tax=Echinococcus granulosus TaxID=6210 RepID=A0A068WH26_ECHGR|nr:hypothetical protein ECG_06514 [Echinococcus granulosus]CDS19390.1 expressed protein [Echinococcus granulosus]